MANDFVLVSPTRPPQLSGTGNLLQPPSLPPAEDGGGLQTPGVWGGGTWTSLGNLPTSQDAPPQGTPSPVQAPPSGRSPWDAPPGPPRDQPGHAPPHATPPPDWSQVSVPQHAAPPDPASLPPLSPPSAGAVPPAPQMRATRSPAPQGDMDAALQAFCHGAGIDPAAASRTDTIALMHMLGLCTRVATEQLMAMLRARGEVKKFTRSGQRTQLSAVNNNPMKFLPDGQQALETMFLAQRDGFMSGAEAFEDALSDVRTHQEAVFMALQPALADLLDGLSPEQIEQAETTGNLLGGGRKGRLWQAFVSRWDEKADAGEHGMLDAFHKAFAKAYAEAAARKGRLD